jgi:uncharacterized protein
MRVAGRSTRLMVVLALLASVLVASAARPVRAADPPAGATWTETYIDTPDGERLHVDVLRPEGLDDDDKTPTILIVSPYLGMVGQTSQPGPSDRFYDFFEGAKVFKRGYSVVQVSLRGSGGSSGCLDILGPGEQLDIETAVEWTTSQPWSNGRVGMYGKSYDANTGVAGAALQPKGLAAVVAQQIVPDRYRGSYSDRVRYLQSLAYPGASYGAQGEGAFSVNNDPEYIANSVTHTADCQAGLAEHYRDDPTSEFWTVRDFAKRAKGSKVPTFITTGYLDANTNVGGGVIDFFNALKGPKRMWIGWWDHVRGNDKVGERLAMGRKGFFDEVMRFFDRYVKGVPAAKAPTHRDSVIAAQGSDGKWRSEKAWPPKDARTYRGLLLPGSYVDDARNLGSNDAAAGPGGSGSAGEEAVGYGSWTFSQPLRRAVQVAGVPRAGVKLVTVAPRTNVVVNVYDVAPDGSATMVTRGAALADESGVKKVEMYPTDWTFERGHRIGLLVSGANAEAYVHTPTNTTVEVAGGGVLLPLLSKVRKSNLQGAPAPRLETWRSTAPFPVDEQTIKDRTNKKFRVPRR